MPDYSLGKIYKIVNDIDDEIYIGSTADTLSRRFSGHKVKAKRVPNRKIYLHFDLHGIECFRIVLVENWSCDSKDELTMREEFWRKELQAGLNSRCCYLSKEARIEYNRQYNELNKERVAKRDKVFRQENKERIAEYTSSR